MNLHGNNEDMAKSNMAPRVTAYTAIITVDDSECNSEWEVYPHLNNVLSNAIRTLDVRAMSRLCA
jgi:hypothetical protein